MDLDHFQREIPNKIRMCGKANENRPWIVLFLGLRTPIFWGSIFICFPTHDYFIWDFPLKIIQLRDLWRQIPQHELWIHFIFFNEIKMCRKTNKNRSSKISFPDLWIWIIFKGKSQIKKLCVRKQMKIDPQKIGVRKPRKSTFQGLFSFVFSHMIFLFGISL